MSKRTNCKTTTDSFPSLSEAGDHSHELSHLSQRLINRKQLRELIPVSNMTLWRWERDGLIPQSSKIGGKAFWRLREIVAAIDALVGSKADSDEAASTGIRLPESHKN